MIEMCHQGFNIKHCEKDCIMVDDNELWLNECQRPVYFEPWGGGWSDVSEESASLPAANDLYLCFLSDH
jgi:hypothetical protein